MKRRELNTTIPSARPPATDPGPEQMGSQPSPQVSAFIPMAQDAHTDRGESPALEHRLSLVLRNFAHTMGTDFPIQSILDHLVAEIVAMLPVTAAGVTLIAPDTQPRYIAASDEAALRYERLQTELDEGPFLMAFRSGRSVAVPNLRTEDRFPRFTPRALQAGLRAVFTFPLRHEQQPLGALDLYRDTPGPLGQEATEAAQTLADVAAAYLLNAQARLDLQKANDRSEQQALHDVLTELPNRMLILDRLQHAIGRQNQTGQPCAVLFIDLDRLKSVNDTHGHATGDELLIAAASRLAELIRPGDTLGRLSGDEFVILCEDLDNFDHASAIAGRLLTALTQPFILTTARVDITASIGIARAGQVGQSPHQVLDEADSAMYQAKRSGGNRHQVFDPDLKSVTIYHSELEQDLRSAVERGQLHTAYQPIVHTGDGRITGFEALLRWNHPTHGPIPPATLIPLAEESGLIDRLGSWVLQRACTDMHRWQHASGQPLGIAVNVSPHQLMSTRFPDTVSNILDAAQCNPKRLTLEVTENVFMADKEVALTVLRDLRSLGITLALDDFGTGYAALNYLQTFPIDILKIDRSFVAELGRDPAANVIVAAIVQLAHGLGMAVVAEGVETIAQHSVVAALGCNSSQGFYYAKPMTAPQVTSLIRRGHTHLPDPIGEH
ncbi:MAG: EAL domain-containing protein [Nakamurella sp.]